jgi:predicted RNA-binding Zn-ribbon protein involved in translation (DUF1610 family)
MAPVSTSTYKTARSIAQFISFIGWAGVLLGGGLTFVGIVSLVGFFLVPTGIGLIIGSLLLVGTGQMTRATVDTADYSAQMLAIMRGTHLPNEAQTTATGQSLGDSSNVPQNTLTASPAIRSRHVTFDCPHCNTTIYQRVEQCMFCKTPLTDEEIDAAVEAYRTRKA